MFANKVGPYHRKHKRSEDDENISKQDYARSVIYVIMNKAVKPPMSSDLSQEQKERLKNKNFKEAFTNERVSSFYEEHLDLYRLWQVR